MPPLKDKTKLPAAKSRHQSSHSSPQIFFNSPYIALDQVPLRSKACFTVLFTIILYTNSKHSEARIRNRNTETGEHRHRHRQSTGMAGFCCNGVTVSGLRAKYLSYVSFFLISDNKKLQNTKHFFLLTILAH